MKKNSAEKSSALSEKLLLSEVMEYHWSDDVSPVTEFSAALNPNTMFWCPKPPCLINQ